MCALPGEVTESVVVDVRDQAKRERLLRVVQEDTILRCHGEHQSVWQLECVGERLLRAICMGEGEREKWNTNEGDEPF